MNAASQRRLVLVNGLLATAVYVAALVLIGLSAVEGELTSNLSADIALTPVVLLLVVLGAMVVYRRPGNLIGAGMCLTGLLGSLSVFAEAYATYALLAAPGTLPGGALAGWFVGWVWAPAALPALTLLFLLFPDGRALTARWRWLARIDGLLIGALAFGAAFRAGPLEDFPEVDNPLGIGGEGGVIGLVATIAFVSLALAIPLSAIGMVVRFRRSRGLERQQFKWLTFAAVFSGVVFAGSLVLLLLGTDVFTYSVTPIFSAVTLSVGAALLRYRLYDIDRLISRTLTYASLTACLALAYAGVIVALQVTLRSFSGGSSLAVALTTLIVAGLFFPVRQQVQQVVDRRFNRRAYDAAHTVEAFGLRLRQQIDLDTLRCEFLMVVDETMQPSGVSFWLREISAGSSVQGHPERGMS